MNDDPSYAHSARAFALHGRIMYNGWSSPMLLPQILYGAAIIKLFGFTYFALDMSGVVLGGIAAGLMYLLCRTCGLGQPLSVISTGILMLNPISLSIMPSFMTEMPSLVLLLASLLTLVRSVESRPDGVVIDKRRLLTSLILGIVAGSNRQTLWAAYVGALIPLCFAARRDRGAIWGAVFAIVVVAVCLSSWFAHQPYAAAPPVGLLVTSVVRWPLKSLLNACELLDLVGLFSLPLAVLAYQRGALRSPAVLAALIASLVICMLPLGQTYWGGRLAYVSATGGGPRLIEGQCTLLPWTELLLRPLLRVLGACSFAFLALTATRSKLRRNSLNSTTDSGALLFRMMLGSVIVQLLALVPWFALSFVFDRYVLSLIPGLLIAFGIAVVAAQDSSDLKARLRPAVIAMISLWIVSFLFGWEYMRYTAARASATRYLLAEGVPPSHIDGGFEFNADTHLAAGKHLDSPILGTHGEKIEVRTAYYIATTPTVEWSQTDVVRRFPYASFSPPFIQNVYVLRVKDRHASNSRPAL